MSSDFFFFNIFFNGFCWIIGRATAGEQENAGQINQRDREGENGVANAGKETYCGDQENSEAGPNGNSFYHAIRA